MLLIDGREKLGQNGKWENIPSMFHLSTHVVVESYYGTLVVLQCHRGPFRRSCNILVPCLSHLHFLYGGFGSRQSAGFKWCVLFVSVH